MPVLTPVPPVVVSAVSTEPLSGQLRAHTAAAHAGAEHSPFLSALAEGRVTACGLAALLGRLRPVYAALEELARGWGRDPAVGVLVVPGLERTARIDADLGHLGAWPDVDSPAARAYAGRVTMAGRSRAGFVAHHYTRYLGDLSGGRVLRAAVHRSLGVTDEVGATFFAFPGLRPGVVKKAYRAALDALPFDDAERAHLLAEALEAYRLNVALTAELDADLARWTVPAAVPAPVAATP